MRLTTLLFCLALSSALCPTAKAELEFIESPRLIVEGIPHKIVMAGYFPSGYQDSTESGPGFCTQRNGSTYEASISTQDTSGPYVLLHADGRIWKLFEDSFENQNRFWTADHIECRK